MPDSNAAISVSFSFVIHCICVKFWSCSYRGLNLAAGPVPWHPSLLIVIPWLFFFFFFFFFGDNRPRLVGWLVARF